MFWNIYIKRKIFARNYFYIISRKIKSKINYTKKKYAEYIIENHKTSKKKKNIIAPKNEKGLNYNHKCKSKKTTMVVFNYNEENVVNVSYFYKL